MPQCQSGEKELVLTVLGMSCGHCKASVEKAVASLDGVVKAVVDLDGKKVTVTYCPDKVSEDLVVKAISDQGYSVA